MGAGMTRAVVASNDLRQWSQERRAAKAATPAGVRFAFYGRVSTADFQDPETSRQWQFDTAIDLVGGRGSIAVEYFDIGCSRRMPWVRRPQAGALLATLASPDRGFDAVVVGEFE